MKHAYGTVRLMDMWTTFLTKKNCTDVWDFQKNAVVFFWLINYKEIKILLYFHNGRGLTCNNLSQTAVGVASHMINNHRRDHWRRMRYITNIISENMPINTGARITYWGSSLKVLQGSTINIYLTETFEHDQHYYHPIIQDSYKERFQLKKVVHIQPCYY